MNINIKVFSYDELLNLNGYVNCFHIIIYK